MPSALALLRWPAFVWGGTMLFWCFQGACLTGLLQWWKLWGPRSDVEAAVRWLKGYFRYRLLLLGSRKPEAQRKCVYLCNHRSWADFFVDTYAVGARGVALARMAVGVGFPAFASSGVACGSILLFKRGSIQDTEAFNSWLDRKLARGPANSLLVYPEGTRSMQQHSLPLKRGMLRYAFTRQLPVQCVITTNKELVLNSRQKWTHFGCTLVCGCSEVLETSQYSDFEEFMQTVQALWDAEWERVHAASPEGLPELVPSFPGLRYSRSQLAAQSAILAGCSIWLATGIYASARLLAFLAAFRLGLALEVVAATWLAASLAAAALLPLPAGRAGGLRSNSHGSAAPVKQE